MLKQLSFLELAEKVLGEVAQPMTPEEIWREAERVGHAKQVATRGKTPWTSVGAQIYVSMRDDPNSPFCKVGERPRRFSLKHIVGTNGVTDDVTAGSVITTPPTVAVTPSRPTFLESQLHPFLARYAFFRMKSYTKTIRHLQSNKKEFGEWVHPDMVGCYLPQRDWEVETLELSTHISQSAVRLYSFELKRELSFANLRESFFQAVSNSSWANEGYLVAALVSDDDDFRGELSRLSAAFGIGVIALDIYDPDGGEVVFPARERQLLDWDMVNKLAAMNPDFRNFLLDMRIALQTRKVYEERFDTVKDAADLIASLKAPAKTS